MIATQVNRVAYTGDGATVNFPFATTVLNTADIVVVERTISTGVEVTLALDNHYSITGTPDAAGRYVNGVTIVAAVAPSALVQWIIYQDPDITQLVDLTDNGLLPVETQIELPLDRLTVIAQRIKSLVMRTLRQPDGDSLDVLALPGTVSRASKFLAFDSSGDPIAAAGTSANLGPVSGFMDTLLDDADALTARTTLQVGCAEQRVRGLEGERHATVTQFTITGIDSVTLTARNGTTNESFITLRQINSLTVDALVVGVNGRDIATPLTTSEASYIYLIYNGVTPALIVSNTFPPSGPVLPSGYTHYAYLTTVFFSTEFNDCIVRGSNVLFSGSSVGTLTAGTYTFLPSNTWTAVPPTAVSIQGTLRIQCTSTGGGLVDAQLDVASRLNGFNGRVSSARVYIDGLVSKVLHGGPVPFDLPLSTTGLYYRVVTTQGSSAVGTIQVNSYRVLNGDWS